jgi:hypothetical protein
MTPSPIALFTYNRPLHLQRTVKALRQNSMAATSHLHVFCDGPRSRESEAAVLQVRAFARTIDGFAALTVHERARNLGLANSIIEGVTRLCDQHGSVIVVEDDLLVAPHFLEYMNHALELYRDQDRAMQVSGYMVPVDLDADTDAVFLPFTTSWGWATWSRAWRHFDPQMSAFERLAADPALRHAFNLEGAYDYFDLLRRQKRGRVDSWAIRWYLSVFMRGGLTLYPVRSLVQNIGFDGSGTHCSEADISQASVAPGYQVRRFPAEVTLFEDWRRVLHALPRRRSISARLILSKLKQAIG